MSFCNKSSIDDFFLDKPKVTEPQLDVRAESPDIRSFDNGPVRNPLDAEFKRINADVERDKVKYAGQFNKSVADLKGFGLKSQALSKSMVGAQAYINRINQTTGKYGSQKQSITQIAADISVIRASTNAIASTLASGAANLGWINEDAYESLQGVGSMVDSVTGFVDDAVNAAAPFTELVVEQPPGSGNFVVSGDRLLVALSNSKLLNIADRLQGLADKVGLSKLAVSIRSGLASVTNKFKAAMAVLDAKVDYLVGLMDLAEGMLTAAGELVIALCQLIPAILAAIRAVKEWIEWLINNLLNMSLNLDFVKWPEIDWGLLFKFPDLEALRRLRDKFLQILGKQQKLWTTVGVECDPQKVFSWNGPVPNIGELGMAVGKVGAQTVKITAGVNGGLGEGIRKLDAKTGAKLKASDLLWAAGGSVVPTAPARVNPPAGSPMTGTLTGKTPAFPSLDLKLPTGWTQMNETNAQTLHPEEGLAVAPNPALQTSNDIANVTDLIKFTRSGHVTAEASRNIGLAIKILAQPEDKITDAERDTALKVLWASSRRMRLIKNNNFGPDGNKTKIADEYYACHDNKANKVYTVDSIEAATDRLANASDVPPGLEGSVLAIAAFNNPAKFITTDNSTFDPLAEDAKFNAPAQSSIVALAELEKTTAVTENLDRLKGQLPLGAMPSNFYEEEHLVFLNSQLSSGNESLELIPLYMACKTQAEKDQIDALIYLEELLKTIDLSVANSLYDKAFLQGKLGNNSYTYLAITKRMFVALADGRSITELIMDFCLHKADTNMRSLLEWLQAASKQDILSPAVVTDMTDSERLLAEKSYVFLQKYKTDMSLGFITTRINADDVGMSMGMELLVTLAIEHLMEQAEDMIIAGEDPKNLLTKLIKMAGNLTNGKELLEMLKIMQEEG